MAPFRFRLATLLRLRELARDERRGQLAEAQRIESSIAERLQAAEKQLADLLGIRTRAVQPGPLDVDRLLAAQRFELSLRVQERDIQQQLASIRAEVDRRREALVEADREVRVLEKLRDTKQERHAAAEQRSETKMLDEVALLGYAREEIP